MIPCMVCKLAPNLSHLIRGLVNCVPGRGCFRAVSFQNGDKFVAFPSPQSLNGSNDSRPPTAPLIHAAEGTVPLVTGSAADFSADAAATADDADAPPTDAAEGTVPPVAGAAVNAAVSLQKRAPWSPPHRRSRENSTAGRRLCFRYRRRCRAR